MKLLRSDHVLGSVDASQITARVRGTIEHHLTQTKKHLADMERISSRDESLALAVTNGLSQRVSVR